MDNLPNNQGGDNNNPNSTTPSGPPPFGSNFNPHINPPNPNTPNPPYIPNDPESLKHEHYSEAAQEKPRDDHGRFVPTPDVNIPPTVPQPQMPIPQPPSSSEALAKEDNPSSFSEKIKLAWNFFSKNYKKIGIALSFIYLVAMNPSFQNFMAQFFPNSSPVLFRGVNYSGVLKTSDNGLFTLVLPDSSAYTLHLKPSNTVANFKNYNEVIVKGNLSWTPYVIENAEVYPLNISPSNSDATSETKKPSTKANPTPSNPSNLSDSSSTSNLPVLYSKLTWEITQSKTLIFTSGKRKIEQEGVYLESAQVTDYPQDFIDYYTNELTKLDFKQTYNSSEPSGLTTTFAKDDQYLTFGVKNTFTGTGDNKKISGYKAFIEHN